MAIATRARCHAFTCDHDGRPGVTLRVSGTSRRQAMSAALCRLRESDIDLGWEGLRCRREPEADGWARSVGFGTAEERRS